jgi:hypothetical protein
MLTTPIIGFAIRLVIEPHRPHEGAMGRAADPVSGNVRSEFDHQFHYPTGLSMNTSGNVVVTARFVKAR